MRPEEKNTGIDRPACLAIMLPKPDIFNGDIERFATVFLCAAEAGRFSHFDATTISANAICAAS